MNKRNVTQIVTASTVSEGAGVTVHRTIGTPALRQLDPFLMLDHFGSDRPDEYIAGFPDHPHRGFVTLTYMLDGHMLHRDSMGNHGDLRAGGAQWMKAASGIIHSEMPQQTAGLMRGFQLWINLPAREKMTDPAYRDIAPQEIPTVEAAGMRVKVLSGEYGGENGPVHDPATALQYLDVALAAGGRFAHRIDPALSLVLYPFEGDARVGETRVAMHSLAVLSGSEELEVMAGGAGTRFIVVAGRPIGEPVVQYGPFVMNTREEIEQAYADYRDGRLVRTRAGIAE
jgi:redox-sensitive bicupin YhaK (pirin superfamily)